MQDRRVLLVDDEPDILELIKYNLEKENYTVETAENGRQALEKAQKFQPHLILLDVMMPEMDGIETCIELRKLDVTKDTVVAFLTARSEDYSQVAGFDAGADDYIAKPIKPRVLISRVKALIRRATSSSESTVHSDSGELVIDREKYIITRNGEEINLPRKEFELLSLLLSKPGKVFNRDSILNEVWGSDVVVGDRTIDVHVRKLREKIGDKYIKTIKGVGYKFQE